MKNIYSYEITKLLNQYNNSIPSSLYRNIIYSSPQIDHTIYKPFGNYFESWDKSGTYWKYSVYNDT